MRKIKFRVWDEQFKRMCKKPEQIRLNVANGNVHGSRSGGNVETWKLMQFTGLKDVNGVEIFEGDIIGAQDNSGRAWYVSHHEIVWHDSGFMGKQICSNGSLIGIDFWTRGSNGYVVIGNIYENPELLGANHGKDKEPF